MKEGEETSPVECHATNFAVPLKCATAGRRKKNV